MIVMATGNGHVGIRQAVEALKQGKGAVDAVEIGIREVEVLREDRGVGLHGTPNILGVTEQDALIMDGRTRNVGAVGAVKGYDHPISIARHVMEKLMHVFLVGEGAERFASEMGIERSTYDTSEVRELWKKHVRETLGMDDPESLASSPELWKLARLAVEPDKAGGTTNFIARDSRGDICVGVSTSGWGWKYPGRLGDSPVISAGGYADNRYGAAACTGTGELTIRAGTARFLVACMKLGMSLEEATVEALKDLNDLTSQRLGGINIIAMDAGGAHFSGATGDGRGHHIYMTPDMSDPEKVEGTGVPVKGV
jgi:isoaspartyl peptidase/L-asparaginase-like protein (Ntn-hydrolase superfamily)